MNYCQFRNETIKRMANAGGGGLLPRQYQQVEYIRAYHSEYIVTDIIPTRSTIIKAGIMFGVYGTFCLFGMQNSDNSTAFKWYALQNNNVRWGNTTTTVNMALNTSFDITLGNGYATCNGTSIYIGNTYKDNVGYKIALFGNNISGTVSQLASGRIFYFKVDGQCDMVPCYRKADNKPGMYDLVTNTFFTNAGTGEFTVGNDV